MKDLKDRLLEKQASQIKDLLAEVQSEDGDKAEYHTFDFSKGQKKFKKGFLTFNKANGFITLTCFNTAKDLAEVIGADEDMYDEYDGVEVGECKTVDDNSEETQVLRIW